MSLKDLHRKLYTREGEEFINREKSYDDYNIEKKQKTGNVEIKSEEDEKMINKIVYSDTRKQSFLNKKNLKFIGIFATVLLLISGTIIGFIRYKQRSFSPEKINIEFKTQEVIKSGDSFDYNLIITNNNNVSLEDAEIKIKYPKEIIPSIKSFMEKETENSFVIKIGTIEKKEVKEYPLNLEVFSVLEEDLYLNTDLYYHPANFNSNFNKKESHLVQVVGSTVNFSLISQQEVVSGETIDIKGVLSNNTSLELGNLVLKLDYPENFDLKEIKLNKIDGFENIFKFPSLKPNEKQEITILGNFSGEIDSVKKISATIGILNERGTFSGMFLAEESVKVVPSRILIDQILMSGSDEFENTSLGKVLRYKIDFKNNSTNPLLDLVVKERINTDLLDHGSVNTNGGYYDQEKQEIIWRASDLEVLKGLDPGESGSIEFSVKLVEDPYLEDNDINKIIATQASINSMNVNTSLISNREISSSVKEIKVSTNLDIIVSGEYQSDVFKNSGPVPLKTGEETTFTLKINLRNNFNEIESSNLIIKLPSGIIWKDRFHRSSGEVSFNDRSNEINWKIDSIENKTGYGKPTKELVFQIGFIKQPNLTEDQIILINSVNFSGYEKFLEKNLNKATGEFRLVNIKDYDF